MKQKLQIRKKKKASKLYQLKKFADKESYEIYKELPEREIILYQIPLIKIPKPIIMVKKPLSTRYSFKTTKIINLYPTYPIRKTIPEISIKKEVLQISNWKQMVQQARKTISVFPVSIVKNAKKTIKAKILSSNLPNELYTYNQTRRKYMDKNVQQISASSKRPEEYLETFYKSGQFSVFNQLIRIDWTRPKIILAYKPKDNRLNYMEFLIMILRDIYRIRKGRLPLTRYISSLKELDDVWPLIRASDCIIVFDYERLREEVGKPNIKNIIKNRLRELLTQSFGFYVFYVSEDNLRELQEEIFKDTLWRENKSEIIEVRMECDINYLLNILASYVGFDHINVVFHNIGITSRTLESRYYEILEKSLNDRRVLYVLKLNVDREAESTEHLLFKASILKILLDDYGYGVEELACEEELGDKVIDICIKSFGKCSIAIEVETLYGTKIPILKLRDDIITRCRDPTINELWIILPNYALFLYGRELLKFIHEYIRYLRENQEIMCKKIKIGTIKIKHVNGSGKPRLEIVYENSL